MKKLLSLLSVLTIGGTAVPTTIATSPYQKEEQIENIKHKRQKQNNNKINSRPKRENSPLSLQNICSTINIGKIARVNKRNILKMLSEIKSSFFSRPDFIENFVFDTITTESATGHLRQSIRFGENINDIISETITFTINFDSDIFDLNKRLSITNKNVVLELGKTIGNSPHVIARSFINLNNLEYLLTIDDLIITNITPNSALVTSSIVNYPLSVRVSFSTPKMTLSSIITNTDLGNLQDNNSKTIINAVLKENKNNIEYSRVGEENLTVINITPTSAEVIYTNSSSNSSINSIDKNSNQLVNVTFVATNICLSSVITNTDISSVFNEYFFSYKWNLKEINKEIKKLIKKIKNKIIELNSNSGLTPNDIEINFSILDNTNIRFIICSNNDRYIEDIILLYSFSELTKLITNTELGILPNNNDDTILNAIIELNPNFRLESNNLIITNITPNSATVNFFNNENDIYFGNVIVHFNPQIINLWSILNPTNSNLSKLDLGELPDNSFSTILEAVIKREPNNKFRKIFRNNLRIIRIDRNSAELEINNFNDVPIQGSIIVHFNPAIIYLSSVITNTNLGELPDNSFSTILEAVIRTNPHSGLTVNDLVAIRVTTNSATITSRNNNYSGNVYVTFNINNKNSKNKRPLNFNNDEDDKDKFKKSKYDYNQQNDIDKQSTTTKKPNAGSGSVSIIRKTNLANILINTYLGELQNNQTETILNKILKLNNNVEKNDIEISAVIDNWASIIPTSDSKYEGAVMINFILNKNNYNKYHHLLNKYNSLSKEEKQQKLNEINQHYQNLSENDKKVFKDKLKNVGLGLTSTGIYGAGILGISKMTGISPIKGLSTTANYIRNSLSSTSTSVSTGTGEAMEITPLLSESTVAEGLTAAETLSVAEGTAVVATEGAVIGTEVGTAATLAPETLGLSLVIGGLAIAGTEIIWWLSNYDNNSQAVKHESHIQYNEIEKYYKFLAHDQLKLDINSNEWNKIRQIYQENSNNYQEFKNKIKSEIINFHKEDHSGWDGSITDDDINTLIKALFDNFSKINKEFLSNHKHGWTIVTNTIGSYFMIEEEK